MSDKKNGFKELEKISETISLDMDEYLKKPVSYLALQRRAVEALEKQGIQTVEDLVQLTDKELLAIHGIGPAAVRDVIFILCQMGLSLRSSLLQELAEAQEHTKNSSLGPFKANTNGVVVTIGKWERLAERIKDTLKNLPKSSEAAEALRGVQDMMTVMDYEESQK